MYCSHCGMKLPNWAHYCERCGTRVMRARRKASRLEGTGLDDAAQQRTSAQLDASYEQAGIPSDEGFDPHGLTINEAIRQEIDNLAEPIAPEDPESSNRPAQLEEANSPELSVNDVIRQELDNLATQTTSADDESASQEAAEEGDAELVQSGSSDADAADLGELSDLTAAEESEGSGGDPGDGPAAESSEEVSADAPSEDAVDAFDEGFFFDQEANYDERTSNDELDIWSTLQFERIDVGEDDYPTETYVPTYHRKNDERWRIQENLAQQSIVERQKRRRSKLPKALVTVISMGIILLVLAVTYPVLDWAMQGKQPIQQETTASPQIVSKRRAKKIVKSLEGWWTTNRTFDGRFWRIKGGVLETYAADGNLTKKRKIKLEEIEVASEALEGIEGKAYYLRSINFYLLDADPDTLHALNAEGEANEEANLIRTDEPSFVENKEDKS